MRFSRNVASLEPSATLVLAARAKRLKAEGRSIVDLTAGEPSFPTPAYAAEAAAACVRDGRTGYPPTQGIPELRRAVAGYLETTTGHSGHGPEDVLVSAGVKQALFNCAYCLFEPSDEVLVPTPCWTTYFPLTRLTGATPVAVPTTWDEEWQLDPDNLERLRTPRTRGLLLNSPGNPTGVVYDAERLGRIVEWCVRHGVWLLSDEIYRRLCFDGASAPSVFDTAERSELVILLDGVSKMFSMTGWRIGFAVGPREIIARATDLQSQTTSGAAAPSQYAAAAALADVEKREAVIREFRDVLERRRDVALAALAGTPGLEVRRPAAALFLFVRLAGRDGASADVAERLLMEGGVACVPGEAFGAPGYLRFSFAADEAEIREGFGRVAAFFRD